ncbi:dimethyl sulfoxide reductase [Vibrio splendidus]|uniref:Dimethyl sulfoxide reductase n=1 Tax=Vibrio splendidus TaxID=29497 RepID=A0A2N7F5M5_VIBSP|nr:DmsC/YnfH family molybdoenzyme membrane anchor subunit [Vibrio splendidus]PMI72387.1 dimethyl sulfoxide reductase [Vibrio splendidus]PMJ60894.1 dimethyl sulfoxide reductase [Vibrio splendidus]PMK51682.1 dimethyl sulfoxide reductase [Vibrio splendidus]
MSQLSLVFFTVLAQSAVGMFLALGLVEIVFKPNKQAMTRSFMAVIVLLGVGAIASVTHLGQPFRMFNVAFGLAHGSALSLEIVALSLFGGSAVVYIAMRLFDLKPNMQKMVLPVAMVLGVVFVLAISNVYTLPTVPTWYSSFTPFQFLMTASVVGPVAAAAALSLQTDTSNNTAQRINKALYIALAIMVLIALSGYAGYLVWLSQLETPVNPFDLVNNAPNLIATRVCLLVGGLVMSSIAFLSSRPRAPWLVISFVMIFGAELIGRIFFYDVYLRASTGM